MNILENAKASFFEGLRHFKNCAFQDAERSFLKSLKFAPNRSSTLNNLAATQIKLEKFVEAEINLKQVLEIDNKSIDLWLNFGALYLEKNQPSLAITYLETCLELDRQNVLAWKLIAQAHDQNRDFNKASIYFKKILESDPSDLDALIGMGAILNDLKEYNAAIQYHQLTIEIDPYSASGYVNMAVALSGLQKLDQSLNYYSIALELAPSDSEILSNKAITLNMLQRYEEAIAHFDKAISLKADYAEAWSNKGNTLHELKRYSEALTHYDKAISLKFDFIEAWASKGAALHELKRYSEALTHYDKAISLKANYAEAWSNKGITLNMLQRYEEAIAHFDKAISLKDDIDWIFGNLIHTKMKICDWSGLVDSLDRISDKVMKNKKVTAPFALLALYDDALFIQKSTKIYVKDKFPPNPSLGPIFKNPAGQKIRIGYFSADFHNHATGHLMAELFELHNKNQFELIGFSFGPIKNNDNLRMRLMKPFDTFIEVSNKSDFEISQLSRSINIDIAVDLKGFTQDSRTGIFAYRAAPIQVNYLGYPGSMCTEYIDYIIADKTLIPTECQSYYSEKVVYLPNSYQVNDRKRLISEKKFTRKQLGLPENSFVFCCFNNSYKILTETFCIWMHILKETEDSVLWLLKDNSFAEKNLKEEAQKHGVDPQRLVFADRLSSSDHLARHLQADLFLDTFPCNAHTTASDALWTGLPILTLMGQSFASRVTASLLNAVGLTELITNTQKDYENLAIELATDTNKISSIKLKLVSNRLTTPLFDTPLFTKNLEASYIKMYGRYLNDLLPDHIYLN
jgi:predicted O-linked N-acetylglucosamine transferase (SPINDLY family)